MNGHCLRHLCCTEKLEEGTYVTLSVPCPELLYKAVNLAFLHIEIKDRCVLYYHSILWSFCAYLAIIAVSVTVGAASIFTCVLLACSQLDVVFKVLLVSLQHLLAILSPV